MSRFRVDCQAVLFQKDHGETLRLSQARTRGFQRTSGKATVASQGRFERNLAVQGILCVFLKTKAWFPLMRIRFVSPSLENELYACRLTAYIVPLTNPYERKARKVIEDILICVNRIDALARIDMRTYIGQPRWLSEKSISMSSNGPFSHETLHRQSSYLRQLIAEHEHGQPYLCDANTKSS